MSIRKHGDILAGQNSINIKTDAELDPVSENPIQNRAVTEGLNEKQDIRSEVVVVNGSAVTVVPGKAYKWNVSGDGVLTFSGTSDKYETVPIYINLAEGATVTASGVSIPHEITSSGWYEVKWDGTNGVLDKSDSADASDIEDSTKHQSVQETLDDLQNEKVGKPNESTEGHLMEFDENGDALDSGIDKKTVVVHPGSYDDLHAGTAGNLVDDKAPSTRRTFGFDTACGDISITDNGNASIKTMYGTTYVMNQLVPDEEGEYDISLIKNCKYLFRDSEGNESILTGSTSLTSKHMIGGVSKLINLTHWFGRGHETSIENFYKLFPTWKDADIPYVPGTILNYKGTGVQTIGFNAYNHATGTAELLGGNKYQICGTYTSVSYVDQWGETEELELDDKGIFTPMNNGVLTVVGGNATDTCVHLVWSGYKNFGEPDYKWEEYGRNVRTWDITPYFQEGMNGIGTVQDEMTNNSMTRRFGVVDLGTLSWNKNATSGNFSATVSSMDDATGRSATIVPNILCEGYPVVNYVSGASTAVTDKCMTRNTTTGSGRNIMVHDSNYATAEEFKEAVSGIILIYPLATPITTTFDQPLNLTYPVNDFGTEQSLPINTTELLSTDLDADIQYSIDFTRTVQHYSEIEKDVEGLVAEKDNLARQDGDYATKGLGAKTAQQLVDPNAPATERKFGFDTACGDITIADNGTASPEKLLGTTHVANQLVHDTNMNTKSSTDRKLALTDAVGGNLGKLEIHGGCVVHNQLVKESISKTVTGTGRLGCSDGVAGNAESFVMTAPRSVVMNQFVQNGNFANGSTDWNSNGTLSVVLGIATATITDASVHTYIGQHKNGTFAGHRIICHITGIDTSGLSSGTRLAVLFGNINQLISPEQDNTYTVISDVTSDIYDTTVRAKDIVGASFSISSIQVVDLTQYFNGNTTLINSIQTWDDLVAYDSSFASYVPYNIGTVKGIQPTVKVNHATDVACPVELFGVTSTYKDQYDAVSGMYIHNIASVDMGSLSWSRSNNNGSWANYVFITSLPSDAVSVGGNVVLLPDFTYNDGVLAYSSTADGFRLISRTLYVKADKYTTAADFKTAMTGHLLYYPLATPTTSQYNPTAIPMVDIYNSAVQTAGTRQCPLSLTYDGREQTIALNPTHTYVFNDNQVEDSVLTNESSIDAVGGEDMLVDVTQLYNGDSARISQIQRWASLSTRFHRYRDLMPYNPGTVEPDTPVVRNYPDEYAYGVIYDPNQSSPACVKVELRNGVVSEVTDFSSMPCHKLYRCVMDDLANRHIAYYLDDEDSNKKYNGTRNGVTSDGSASVLTGADGDVMVEIPISYWYLDEDYNGEGKVLWLISDRPFMGTHGPAEIHDFFYVSPDGGTLSTQYVGAYKASICNADGTPLNTTEGALSQATGTSGTNKARSIAGTLPYVNVNLNDFTVRAVRNGSTSVDTLFHQWLMLLMVVEQGSLNTQAISQGYSNGIQSAYCFWRKSGRVNAGNGTAEIFANENSQDMDNFQSLKVSSTTVQRDTLMDADGRYAWSIYNRNASSVRYFTDSPTPSNGDTVYSASTGDTTSGTVASYTIKAENLRVVQWQYRGIENPFGEVWEFEHGIQVYNDAALLSIKVNNVVYTRNPSMDGPASRAFVNGEDYRWVGLTLPSNAHAFLDANLSQDSGYVASAQAYLKYRNGYWETSATADYTMTTQQTAANPVYTWKAFPWALSNGYVRKFDPRTFLAKTVGGSASTYLSDYYWTTTNGSRVSYVGGYAYSGSYGGLGFRSVSYGLTYSSVGIGGRVSASKPKSE